MIANNESYRIKSNYNKSIYTACVSNIQKVYIKTYMKKYITVYKVYGNIKSMYTK